MINWKLWFTFDCPALHTCASRWFTPIAKIRMSTNVSFSSWEREAMFWGWTPQHVATKEKVARSRVLPKIERKSCKVIFVANLIYLNFKIFCVCSNDSPGSRNIALRSAISGRKRGAPSKGSKHITLIYFYIKKQITKVCYYLLREGGVDRSQNLKTKQGEVESEKSDRGTDAVEKGRVECAIFHCPAVTARNRERSAFSSASQIWCSTPPNRVQIDRRLQVGRRARNATIERRADLQPPCVSKLANRAKDEREPRAPVPKRVYLYAARSATQFPLVPTRYS